jgi:hypothetical protein
MEHFNDLKEKEKADFRRKVIDYIYLDLQKRSLESILADILLNSEDYKNKIKSKI